MIDPHQRCAIRAGILMYLHGCRLSDDDDRRAYEYTNSDVSWWCWSTENCGVPTIAVAQAFLNLTQSTQLKNLVAAPLKLMNAVLSGSPSLSENRVPGGSLSLSKLSCWCWSVRLFYANTVLGVLINNGRRFLCVLMCYASRCFHMYLTDVYDIDL